MGVKGAESGGKLRLLRRPFHPDVQLLRIHNLGEKGAETGFGQAPALVGLAAFVSRNLPPLLSIYSFPPTPATNSANVRPIAAALDIQHAALSPSSGPSDGAPFMPAFLASAGRRRIDL